MLKVLINWRVVTVFVKKVNHQLINSEENGANILIFKEIIA